jgi:Phosphotransferase enzyme family
VHAPDWLVGEFISRPGGDIPTLLRNVSAPVWAGGHLVAKMHPTPSQARHEQLLAQRFQSAFNRVTAPLGVSTPPDGVGMLSWWLRLPDHGPAAPAKAIRWLRTAHDHTPTADLPSAPLLVPSRPPHQDAIALHEALAPWRRQALDAAAKLAGLLAVVIHGDANPTNIVDCGPPSAVALDFGLSGRGPRVYDVATVTVLATETGTATTQHVLDTYGHHRDVTPTLLRTAAQLVAINRAQACTWAPWLDEGWSRLHALHEQRPFLFAPEDHPK